MENTEEVLYNKIDSAEGRIYELEEKFREALDNEKSMRFQLEDVEYSEVVLLPFVNSFAAAFIKNMKYYSCNFHYIQVYMF